MGPEYVEPGEKAMLDIGAAQLAKGQAAMLRANHEVATAKLEARNRNLVRAAKLLVSSKADDFAGLQSYLGKAGIDVTDDPEDVALGLSELNEGERMIVCSFLKELAGRIF